MAWDFWQSSHGCLWSNATKVTVTRKSRWKKQQTIKIDQNSRKNMEKTWKRHGKQQWIRQFGGKVRRCFEVQGGLCCRPVDWDQSWGGCWAHLTDSCPSLSTYLHQVSLANLSLHQICLFQMCIYQTYLLPACLYQTWVYQTELDQAYLYGACLSSLVCHLWSFMYAFFLTQFIYVSNPHYPISLSLSLSLSLALSLSSLFKYRNAMEGLVCGGRSSYRYIYHILYLFMNIWCCTEGESTSDFSFIPTAYVEGEWFKSLAKWWAFWKYPECGPYPSYLKFIFHKSTTAHLSYLSPRNGGRAGGRGNGAKDSLAHASDDLRCGVRQWGAAHVAACLRFICDKNPVRKMCFMWGLHMKEQKRVHPRSILTWERTCDLIYPFCGPRCYVESNLNPHSTEPFASVITSQHQHVRQTGFVWISPPFNPGFFRGG